MRSPKRVSVHVYWDADAKARRKFRPPMHSRLAAAGSKSCQLGSTCGRNSQAGRRTTRSIDAGVAFWGFLRHGIWGVFRLGIFDRRCREVGEKTSHYPRSSWITPRSSPRGCRVAPLPTSWTRDTMIGLESRLVISQPDAVSNMAVSTFDKTLAVRMTVNATEPKAHSARGRASPRSQKDSTKDSQLISARHCTPRAENGRAARSFPAKASKTAPQASICRANRRKDKVCGRSTSANHRIYDESVRNGPTSR